MTHSQEESISSRNRLESHASISPAADISNSYLLDCIVTYRVKCKDTEYINASAFRAIDEWLAELGLTLVFREQGERDMCEESLGKFIAAFMFGWHCYYYFVSQPTLACLTKYDDGVNASS